MKIKRQEKISHILRKATEAFAEKGYSGVSTNEIADLAGISKRSMYYYMGDKDTLYSAVISNILTDGNAFLKKYMDSDGNLSPIEKLHNFIYAVSLIGKNNVIHSIILRELLSGGEYLPKHFITESLGHIFDYFATILEEGEAKKVFTKINPMVGTLMTLSFFVYWKLNVPHFDKASKYYDSVEEFGEDVTDPLVDEFHRMFAKMLAYKK